MVLVTMKVRAPDWDRFREAVEWIYGKPDPDWLASRVFRAEGDPGTVLVVDEWRSHEASDRFAERHGAEFNRRAGLEPGAWEDHVWQESGLGRS